MSVMSQYWHTAARECLSVHLRSHACCILALPPGTCFACLLCSRAAMWQRKATRFSPAMFQHHYIASPTCYRSCHSKVHLVPISCPSMADTPAKFRAAMWRPRHASSCLPSPSGSWQHWHTRSGICRVPVPPSDGTGRSVHVPAVFHLCHAIVCSCCFPAPILAPGASMLWHGLTMFQHHHTMLQAHQFVHLRCPAMLHAMGQCGHSCLHTYCMDTYCVPVTW